MKVRRENTIKKIKKILVDETKKYIKENKPDSNFKIILERFNDTIDYVANTAYDDFRVGDNLDSLKNFDSGLLEDYIRLMVYHLIKLLKQIDI